MSKALKPLIRRIKLALGRGIIRLVNDADGIQKMQASLLRNETRSNMERFQEYGFTSVPKPGAEMAAIFIGGVRDHGIVIATEDRRYRLKGLASGEVALYTDEGDKIHLKRGREIEVTTETFTVNCENHVINATTKSTITAPSIELAASSEVTFTTPLARCSGDMIDNFNTNSNNLGAMRDIYNSHVHPENDSGGPTDDPNQQM